MKAVLFILALGASFVSGASDHSSPGAFPGREMKKEYPYPKNVTTYNGRELYLTMTTLKGRGLSGRNVQVRQNPANPDEDIVVIDDKSKVLSGLLDHGNFTVQKSVGGRFYGDPIVEKTFGAASLKLAATNSVKYDGANITTYLFEMIILPPGKTSYHSWAFTSPGVYGDYQFTPTHSPHELGSGVTAVVLCKFKGDDYHQVYFESANGEIEHFDGCNEVNLMSFLAPPATF